MNEKRIATVFLRVAFVVFLFGSFFFLFWTSDANVYWLKSTDLQNDYFFRAALLSENAHLGDVIHPGVPAYYLLSLIERLVGNPFQQTAKIFDLAYLVVIASTAAAFGYFLYVTRRMPAGIALAALLPLLAWPPFWYYLTCYGADSWVIPFGILLLSGTWSAIFSDSPPSPSRLLLLGICSGLAAAIKLSLLPVAGICFVALLARNGANTRARILLMPVVGLISFLIAVAPAMHSLPGTIRQLVAPPDYLTSQGSAIFQFFILLVNDRGGLLTLASIPITAAAAIGALCKARGKHDQIAAAILLLLFLAFFAKVVTLTGVASLSATAMRNSSAAIVALPFGTLLAWRLWGKEMAPSIRFAVVAIVGLASIVCMMLNLSTQRDFVAGRQEEDARLQHAIQAQLPRNRIALLGLELGRAGFHFYGNEAYGRNAFDSSVLSKFPQTGYLLLRQFAVGPKAPPQQQPGLKALWKRMFPAPPSSPTVQPVLMHQPGTIPGLAVVGEDSLEADCDLACLVGALSRQGYKVTNVSRTPYRTRNVLLLTLAAGA